jgi:hypothetical protein
VQEKRRFAASATSSCLRVFARNNLAFAASNQYVCDLRANSAEQLA